MTPACSPALPTPKTSFVAEKHVPRSGCARPFNIVPTTRPYMVQAPSTTNVWFAHEAAVVHMHLPNRIGNDHIGSITDKFTDQGGNHAAHSNSPGPGAVHLAAGDHADCGSHRLLDSLRVRLSLVYLRDLGWRLGCRRRSDDLPRDGTHLGQSHVTHDRCRRQDGAGKPPGAICRPRGEYQHIDRGDIPQR